MIDQETETHGYFTGSEYELYTVFQGMNPSRMRFVAAVQGIRAPDIEHAFRYCELGCGQGFSLLMHAALHPQGQFHGVDFAEGQVAKAQSLAREMGLDNVTFEAASFETFAMTPGQVFDIIALHGVWSWIGRGAQEQILQIIGQRLTPGGMVYLSTNMQPGWADVVPFQSLLLSVRRAMPDATATEVISRFNQLLDLNPQLLKRFPSVRKKLDAAFAQSPNYFEHEYLNASWRPVLFSDLMADMRSAGVLFVGSAVPAQNRMRFRVNSQMQEAIVAFSDETERETIIDAMRAEGFRADYYMREPSFLNREEQCAMIDSTPIAVINMGILGHAEKTKGDTFSDDHLAVLAAVKLILLPGPCLIGDLSSLPSIAACDRDVLIDVVIYLLSIGACEIGVGSMDHPDIKVRAQQFNDVALGLYRMVGRTYQLASPIIRAPIAVAVTDVVCLRALQDHSDPVEELLRIGASKGMQLSTDGAPMTDDAAKRRMVALACKAWPMLRGSELARLGLTGQRNSLSG